jgi:transglutaminase-like putative cysteine protease
MSVGMNEGIRTRHNTVCVEAKPAILPPPSLLRCGFLILAAKAALRLLGFARTYRLIRARLAHQQLIAQIDPEAVSKTERIVALAGALYPGRAMCLEQSLVLYYCLRRAGVQAVFRLGVQAYPFAAHAWVELGGHPVNDILEHVRWFAPVPDLSV